MIKIIIDKRQAFTWENQLKDSIPGIGYIRSISNDDIDDTISGIQINKTLLYPDKEKEKYAYALFNLMGRLFFYKSEPTFLASPLGKKDETWKQLYEIRSRSLSLIH